MKKHGNIRMKHGAIRDDFKSPGIQLAAKKLGYLMMDEKERRAYDDYLVYLGYELGLLETAKADGSAEGIAEEKRNTARNLIAMGLGTADTAKVIEYRRNEE